MKIGKTSKKAQIGSTLTWIAAFLIIFFILLLFLSASAVISKAKKVLSVDYRISAETIEEEPLMQSGMLISLMNSHVTFNYENEEKKATIKNSLEVLSFSDLGQEGIKTQIEKSLLELARFSKPDCYLLKISSNEKDVMEFTSKLPVIKKIAKSSYYEKAEKVYIQGKEGEIITEIFAGRC